MVSCGCERSPAGLVKSCVCPSRGRPGTHGAVPAGRHAGCFPWTRHSRLVQFQGRLIRMTVKWHRDGCPNYVLRPSLQRLTCSSLCERQMTFGLGSTESFGEKRLFLCCLPSVTPLQKGTHCGLTKCGWPRGVVSLAQRDCLPGTCPRPTFWEYRAGRGRAGPGRGRGRPAGLLHQRCLLGPRGRRCHPWVLTELCALRASRL